MFYQIVSKTHVNDLFCMNLSLPKYTAMLGFSSTSPILSSMGTTRSFLKKNKQNKNYSPRTTEINKMQRSWLWQGKYGRAKHKVQFKWRKTETKSKDGTLVDDFLLMKLTLFLCPSPSLSVSFCLTYSILTLSFMCVSMCITTMFYEVTVFFDYRKL